MSRLSPALVELFNHSEFPDSLKPALGYIILASLQPDPRAPAFIGFRTPPAQWLQRDIDRFPKCAN